MPLVLSTHAAAVQFGNILNGHFAPNGSGSVLILGEFSAIGVENVDFVITSTGCPSTVDVFYFLGTTSIHVDFIVAQEDIDHLAVGDTCTLQGTITMGGLTLAQESYVITLNKNGGDTTTTPAT